MRFNNVAQSTRDFFAFALRDERFPRDCQRQRVVEEAFVFGRRGYPFRAACKTSTG